MTTLFQRDDTEPKITSALIVILFILFCVVIIKLGSGSGVPISGEDMGGAMMSERESHSQSSMRWFYADEGDGEGDADGEGYGDGCCFAIEPDSNNSSNNNNTMSVLDASITTVVDRAVDRAVDSTAQGSAGSDTYDIR